MQKLIPESYQRAVKEKGVEPLGEPNLEKFDFEEGKPLSYEALFEVRPEIVLPDYRNLEISVGDEAVTQEEIASRLEALREKNAHLVAVEDRPVADGDLVTIDLQGQYLVEEGHSHAHGAIEQENVEVQVGHGNTHEAFSRALEGLNIGEEATFVVDYPEDYPEKKLAGHRIKFTVEVTDIKRRQLPELNDDFARDLGEYDSLEELRQEVEKTLRQEKEKARESELHDRILAQMVELCEFEVPQVLVEQRIDRKLRDFAYNIASQGVDPSRANINWQKMREELRPAAEKDVRGWLILDEAAKLEKIEVLDEHLDQEIDRVAQSLEQPVERVRQFFQKEGRLEDLRNQILRRRAMEAIQKGIRVTLKEP